MSHWRPPTAESAPAVALDPADHLLAPVIARSAAHGGGCSLFGLTGPFATTAGSDGARLAPVLARPTLLVQLTASAADGTAATMTLRGTSSLLALCGPSVPGHPTPTIAFGGVQEAAQLAAAQIAGEWAPGAGGDRAPLAVAWAAARLVGDAVEAVTLNVVTPRQGEPMGVEERDACAAALLHATFAAPSEHRWPQAPIESADPATLKLLDASTVAAGLDGAQGPVTVFSGPGGTATMWESGDVMQVQRSSLGLVATVHALLSETDAEVLTLVCAREDRLLAEWLRPSDQSGWSAAAGARALAGRLLEHCAAGAPNPAPPGA